MVPRFSEPPTSRWDVLLLDVVYCHIQNGTRWTIMEEKLFLFTRKSQLLANRLIHQFTGQWKDTATFFFRFSARVMIVNWHSQIYRISEISYISSTIFGCLLVRRFFFFWIINLNLFSSNLTTKCHTNLIASNITLLCIFRFFPREE